MVEGILRHLRLPTEVPTPRPGRVPLLPLDDHAPHDDVDVAAVDSYA